MTQLTRWIDETEATIESIEGILLSEHNDEINDAATSYINWNITKVFDENVRGIYNGREITYNYYRFSVETYTAGTLGNDDSAIRKTGFLIPYVSGGRLRYIVSRNSDAKPLIRKMMGYTGKGEIQKIVDRFTPDVFIWLISKVYSGNNIIESISEDLGNVSIDSIRGFKGNTEDSLTKISAEGESVMNIISTLSFLIESRHLNQIAMDIAYKEHDNIGITLNNTGSLIYLPERYAGELVNEPIAEARNAKVILALYLEVIPSLIQNYESDWDNEDWSFDGCIEFLKAVAEELETKVADRIEELSSRPEQLRMHM